jgi:hypothetical protein
MLSISVFSVVYFNKDVADWWAAQQHEIAPFARDSVDSNS